MPTLVTPGTVKAAFDYAVAAGVAPDKALACVGEVMGAVALAEVELEKLAQIDDSAQPLRRRRKRRKPANTAGTLYNAAETVFTNPAVQMFGGSALIGGTGAGLLNAAINHFKGNPLAEGLGTAIPVGLGVGLAAPFIPRLAQRITS